VGERSAHDATGAGRYSVPIPRVLEIQQETLVDVPQMFKNLFFDVLLRLALEAYTADVAHCFKS
jgi:hypothetical protein